MWVPQTAFIVDIEAMTDVDSFDRWKAFVLSLGLEPLYDLDKGKPDVMFFTNGPHIHPQMYGEDPLKFSGPFDEERDGLEIYHALLTQDPEWGKRTLLVGSDRGSHLLNVWNGGKLLQLAKRTDEHLVICEPEINFGMDWKLGS